MTIIETSANRFFRVTETGIADLAHVWNGVEVKRLKGAWVDLKGTRGRPCLVRKAATRFVEQGSSVWRAA